MLPDWFLGGLIRPDKSTSSKPGPLSQYSLAWGIFMLFHTSFTVMIHTVSTFLTLTLAIWRFIMIKYPSKAIDLCTLSRCKALLVLGFGNYPNMSSSPTGLYVYNENTPNCSLTRGQTDYERYTWKGTTYSLPNTNHSLPNME